MSHMCTLRAVVTSPVSPVSTGSLFPSPIACLVSPNRANARQMPMARTQCGDMLQHNTRWLRDRVFQQFSVLSSEQSVKGVACEISEWSENRNKCCMVQRAERVDVHARKTLSSGLHFGPEMVSETISWTLNSQNFLGVGGGGTPRDLTSCCVLMDAPLIWPLQSWWLRPWHLTQLSVGTCFLCDLCHSSHGKQSQDFSFLYSESDQDWRHKGSGNRASWYTLGYLDCI